MANVDLWFPTAIYVQDDLISVEDNEKLKNYCLGIQKDKPSGGTDWYGGTYTTHGSYESSKDPEVIPLIEEITKHVHEFAKIYNCQGKYKNFSTWMNISYKDNFQEFHSHPNSVFSAVYYPAAPEGSGGILFEDPREPDMFPLRSVNVRNTLSETRVTYSAKERRLLIFRSYLRHMVIPGINTEPRISFALNFN